MAEYSPHWHNLQEEYIYHTVFLPCKMIYIDKICIPNHTGLLAQQVIQIQRIPRIVSLASHSNPDDSKDF